MGSAELLRTTKVWICAREYYIRRAQSTARGQICKHAGANFEDVGGLPRACSMEDNTLLRAHTLHFAYMQEYVAQAVTGRQLALLFHS